MDAAFTSVRFICSGDEYYDLIVHELDHAQSEIQIESYIFDFDSVGQRILHTLAKAVERNVDVRLMVDGIGSLTQISQIREFCRQNGINFRVYRAIPYIDIVVRHFFRFLKTTNRRNHRKIVVVDKRRAFVASFNISKVHSEKESGIEAWKDLAVLVEGPEVAKISALANAYWRRFPFSVMNRHPKIVFTRVRSTHSIASRRMAKQQVLQRMKMAAQRIQILTPYFVPSKKVIRALIMAAKNNVAIEIIIPSRSDFLIVDLAGRYVLRKLLKYNIAVYQYGPSFMHAKCIVIDQWATLGSHNLNHRSLVHDLEMDITIESKPELEPLENYWNSLKKNSVTVSREQIEKDSFFIRMLCRFSFWFKNWL
jgi:cardiolipin synthase